MKHVQPEDTHFFASSAAAWMTTTPDRDLLELIDAMKREGLTFNLFIVPLPYDADYKIERYQPQVKDTIWLGIFTDDTFH